MIRSQMYPGFALASFLILPQCLFCQGLLVTCANPETCDFKEIVSFSVGGRPVVRDVTAKSIDAVTLTALRASKDKKIDELAGLVRDPSTGQVYVFSSAGPSREMVFPSGSSPKDQAAIAGLWAASNIGYRDSIKAKADQPVAVQTFAAYLTGRDLKEVAVAYARSLIAGSTPGAWKTGLLRGTVAFSSSAPAYKAWTDQLFASSKDALAGYRKQEGDPRHLSDLLSTSIQEGEILQQIAPSDPSYTSVLKDARNEAEVLKRKVAIATAFLAAGYWDESVLKIRELGMAKWSFPNLATGERIALVNSAKLHKSNAERLAGSGILDRAFDEAELAYRRNPCSVEISLYFNSIRPQFVEQNKDPRQADATAGNRPTLQQIERQLRNLDAVQLQQETYRQLGYNLIAQGDALDRTYVPFQLAKAQFLRNVGKLSEALDVVIDVERRYGLDVRQRSDWLDLDANLQTLSVITKKAVDDSAAHFDAGRFTQAVDATTAGLAADPSDPTLLVQRAQASASLRQPEEALRAIQTLFKSGNPACTEPQQYEKAFALRDVLGGGTAITKTAPQAPEPVDGVANWMSGKKYTPGKIYYDPISLSFVPRIVVVDGQKIPITGTSFTWDGLRLVKIETTVNAKTASKPEERADPGQTTFFVDVEYAPGTLRMTAIGPRAIQEGKRMTYSLTFWNDPRINVSLLQATGKPAGRGWAGNPVFDPFIWSGVYLFDFKYDEKGRVIEATPVPDETRGRSFSETLTFTWDDATDRLKMISSKSYRRVMKYDNKGRLVSEEATFRNEKADTNYQYAGDNVVPRLAVSNSVFDQQHRTAFFQTGNY